MRRRLGFYVAGCSWLHTLHPSTKLALYALAFVLAYVVPWPVRWVMAVLVFVGLWWCGVPPSKYKLVLFVTGIATLTVPLLNGLWPNPNDPLVFPLWDDFGFRRDGLETGLAFSGLYTAIGILRSLEHRLQWSQCYMPEAAMHYLDLGDVWRTRGVSFSQGWPWQRFWLQCRLLAALLILEFSQVRTKSNAVEARGFSLKRRATYYILPPIPGTERALMISAALVTAAVSVGQIITFVLSRSA